MIKVPTTIEEVRELNKRHSDAYWFLQGDLTVEQSAKCCQFISDIEEAMSLMSEELADQLFFEDEGS